MALVNRLIAEARRGASHVTINASQVRTLAAHMQSCFGAYESAGYISQTPSSTFIEDEIRAGRATICGVPLRVVGLPKSPSERPPNIAGTGLGPDFFNPTKSNR